MRPWRGGFQRWRPNWSHSCWPGRLSPKAWQVWRGSNGPGRSRWAGCRRTRDLDGVLMVPLGEAAGTRLEIARMWSARRAGVPIVNGYSGNDSPLYRRLRDLQAAAPDPAVQRALYALLHRFGVTTIVADRPVPSMIDESTLLPVAPGVFRIPDAVARVRVDRFEMGRGAALILTDSGWSYPEHNDHESWVWSVQRRATLQVPLGGVPRRQISLLARSQSSEGDELELWWNGRRLGVQPLGETPKLHSFRLPEASSVAGLDRPRGARATAGADARQSRPTRARRVRLRDQVGVITAAPARYSPLARS